MSISTKKADYIPTKKELKDRENKILNNIRVLGVKHDQALKSVQEVEDNSIKLDNQRKEIAYNERILRGLKENITRLTNNICLAKQELELLKKTIDQKEEYAAKLVNDVKINHSSLLAKLNKDMELLNGKKAELETSIVVSKKTIEILFNEISIYEEKLSKLEIRLVKDRVEIEKINPLIKHKAILQRENIELIKNNEILKKDIINREKALKELNKMIEPASQKLQDIEEKYRSIEKLISEKYAKIVADIEKREGDILEKIGWIKDKEEQLKSAKKELEKHFNRKINIII